VFLESDSLVADREKRRGEKMESSAKRQKEASSGEMTIQNVVAVGEVGRQLDIRAMERHHNLMERRAMNATDVKFGEKFHGLILKKSLPEPVVGIVFPSGRVVCTGAKTESNAKTAVMGMLSVVKQIMNPNKPLSALPNSEAPKIQNIMGQFDVGFEIQLELLAIEYDEEVVYEPEIFAPLIFKMSQPKVLMYISVKGKVLMSAMFQDQLSDAQKNIIPILTRFRRSKYGVSTTHQ